MLNFEFTNETSEEINPEIFSDRLSKCYEILKELISEKTSGKVGLVDLVLVSDPVIEAMNLEYRDKKGPTDVISFAYLEVTDFDENAEEILVGDIFISVDTAKKQAKEKKHSFEKEMEILFVHGLLHLLGFDHNNDEEEAEMEGWAKKILTNNT